MLAAKAADVLKTFPLEHLFKALAPEGISSISFSKIQESPQESQRIDQDLQIAFRDAPSPAFKEALLGLSLKLLNPPLEELGQLIL